MKRTEYINYHTYVLLMEENNGMRYCKVGITTDIKKRMRNYRLHNPAITAVLFCENQDLEDDILWVFREERIEESEWFCTTLTADEIIDEINCWGNFKLIARTTDHEGKIK
jgi:hypothetical protein